MVIPIVARGSGLNITYEIESRLHKQSDTAIDAMQDSSILHCCGTILPKSRQLSLLHFIKRIIDTRVDCTIQS
ncbi:hypothetical protein VN97_g8041 [Penicillium thymicola]|uniref:Uncharacterized protein n=1 Tax=Penicillium thymicola TaxID=293382 RepID=A0AAI9TE50_PENTH|nr:hypothetical protein VN97_g8041 [Penicillium thymicola]